MCKSDRRKTITGKFCNLGLTLACLLKTRLNSRPRQKGQVKSWGPSEVTGGEIEDSMEKEG